MVCDAQGRPHAIVLTGGNIADITAAASLVSATVASAELNHLRRFLAECGPAAFIPSTATRKVPIRHDATRHKLRNVIAAVCLVSATTHWA